MIGMTEPANTPKSIMDKLANANKKALDALDHSARPEFSR
jgi:hypothetical protein